MEPAAEYLREAQLFQEDSARLIKDSFYASSLAMGASVLANFAANRILSDERAQAVTDRITIGTAGVIGLIGGLGLAGAVSYQVRASWETHRAHKYVKTQTHLAQLHKFTPSISEVHKPQATEPYDLSILAYDDR